MSHHTVRQTCPKHLFPPLLFYRLRRCLYFQVRNIAIYLRSLMKCQKPGRNEQFAFKRALSRLLEMTSATYTEDAPNVWNPLPSGTRKWETSDKVSGSSFELPKLNRTDKILKYDGCSEEAAHYNQPPLRPRAPRLRPDHVWGVREDWGPGTGTWRKWSRQR